MGFSIDLDISIRNYLESDLQTLQWAGVVEYRNIFIDTYKRKLKGEVVMLVAEANSYPVGMVWLDIDLKSKDGIGIIYALQVVWLLRSKGIGKKLIEDSLEIFRQNNIKTAELSVKKENIRAKKLYLALGFQVVRDEFSRWSYRNLEGKDIEVTEDVWVMQKVV